MSPPNGMESGHPNDESSDFHAGLSEEAEAEFADSHEESGDEHGEPVAPPAEDAPSASGRRLLPVVLAVGGLILLGGGIAWWQFGGGSKEDSALQMISPPPVESGAVVPAKPPSDSGVSPKVASLSGPSEGAESATPSAPPLTLQPPPSVPPLSPAVAPVASPPLPLPPIPSVAPPSVSPPAPIAPVAAQLPPPAQTAAQASASSDLTQRLASFTSHLETLQKQVDKLSGQVGQAAVTAATGSSPAESQTLKDIQARLDKIDQQLQVQKTASPLASGNTSAHVRQAKKPLAAHTYRASKHHRHERAHQFVETPQSPPRTGFLTLPESSQPLPSSSWVLRAAVPGEAWVASSSATRELKPVRVGETLEGVGRVTSIQQKDGAWVVEGTKGTIR